MVLNEKGYCIDCAKAERKMSQEEDYMQLAEMWLKKKYPKMKSDDSRWGAVTNFASFIGRIMSDGKEAPINWPLTKIKSCVIVDVVWKRIFVTN